MIGAIAITAFVLVVDVICVLFWFGSHHTMDINFEAEGWGSKLEALVANGTVSMQQASEMLVSNKRMKRVEISSKDAIQIGMRIGGLKRVPRTGWISRLEGTGVQVESVADHSFRIASLALLLHNHDNQLDSTELLSTALLHDLAETIVGDIAPHQNIDDTTKHKMELDAMFAMRNELENPSVFEQRILARWQKYEQRNTAEAKAIKDLDRFEMVLQAYEYERAANVDLQDFFRSVRGKIQHPQIQAWFEELECMRKQSVI